MINLENISSGIGDIQLKKYNLVTLNVVCKCKHRGGLDILDLELMNTTLLAKWLVRYQDIVTGN
jgi:hypothetical protein